MGKNSTQLKQIKLIYMLISVVIFNANVLRPPLQVLISFPWNMKYFGEIPVQQSKSLPNALHKTVRDITWMTD